MLTLYHANHLDILKDLLIALIKRAPLADPLADEYILVQSAGMAQWLRLQLAEGLGIAAAVQFPLPARFLWDMYVRVLPDVPEQSDFNKGTLTWQIMTLLPGLVDDPCFAPLRHYLVKDADGLKCYQLARCLADLFDQYLVYRPDWLLRWQAGDDLAAITQAHPWQPKLWRALVARITGAGHDHPHQCQHRANLQRQFQARLAQEALDPVLPERVFVLGMAALAPPVVASLQALGQQIDVHLMVTNPCRYYWGDVKDAKALAKLGASPAWSAAAVTKKQEKPDEPCSTPADDLGNPLLASMGKLGRDYLAQLDEVDAVIIDAFADIPRRHLLSHIQADILAGIGGAPDQEKQSLSPDDTSLVVHSCHSPLREVEVLHDQLLALFDQDPGLTPNDIIVMVPDVETYSPWIQAVFGAIAYDDPRYIPFALSDHSVCHQQPVLTGVLSLLTLNNSRCTAPELLALLDIPAIQRRFGLDQASLATLHEWVQTAGIRWGLQASHQATFDLPATDTHTWWFGLRRMLLGYAMPAAAGLYQGIAPLESVQGLEASLCGLLADFIDRIETVVNTLNQARTVAAWTAYINRLLASLLAPDEDDERALQPLRDALTRLNDQHPDPQGEASAPVLLSPAVLHSYLQEQFNEQRSSQRFLTGPVNVCTLMPMRAVPFKVVCLLGMNDGGYPRSLPPVGFNLMVQHRRRGDRSRRDDDRYLFLEALLSAQAVLYISYQGYDMQDNQPKAPSVLVSELLDYCQQRFVLANPAAAPPASAPAIRHWLITEHPLQPFSRRYFTGDQQQGNALFSYAREWLPATTPNQQASDHFLATPLLTAAPPTTITLSELLRFYRNPCRYFFTQRLRVFFTSSDDEPVSSEPFTLQGLTQYRLKQQMLKALIAGETADTLFKYHSAQGTLPHGAAGQQWLEDCVAALHPMAQYLQQHAVNRQPDIAVNETVAGVTLTGQLSPHYQRGLLRYRAAMIKGNDIMQAWITHLGYCLAIDQAGNVDKTTQLVGLGQSIGTYQSRWFQPLSADQARQQLRPLVTLYHDGLNAPLPFFPETASTWLQVPADDQAKAQRLAHTCFHGSGYGDYPGEGDDPYIARSYPALAPVFARMTALAEQLLQPALCHLQSES